MSCVIWTEPEIEAACLRYYLAWKQVRDAATEGRDCGVILGHLERLCSLSAATREALESVPDRAVRPRGEGYTVLLGPEGLFVTESVIRVEPTDAMRLGR